MELNNYIYGTGGYAQLALHRKAIEYDPRNTDNLIILDYFDVHKNTRSNTAVYYNLIDIELGLYAKGNISQLPISFMMLCYEINFAWVSIIQQMIFIDNAYDTFYAEYVEVLNNIIDNDSPEIKHSIVYRNYPNGDSIFHIAAKLWLLEKWEDRKFCITYMMDFSGKTMTEYLSEYLEVLTRCV